MSFTICVAEELTALATKLNAAAEADTESAVSRASDSLRAEAAAATTKLTERFEATIRRLRDDQTQLVAENERLDAENAALSWERHELVAAAQASHRSVLIERLLGVFARVAAAATVDAVMIAAADGLADDLPRVALLMVRDDRLELRYRQGFGEDSGIEKVALPRGVESFLSRTAQAQGVQSISGGLDSGSAPFGGTPTLVVAAPIVVHGETLAVIYADDSGKPGNAPSGDDSIKLAELLRAHAVLRLERLTIELKAVAELRAYAQMLLDEVEYVYNGDAAATMSPADRQDRLQENVRCARQIFQQRTTFEGPAAAGLLDEALARTVDQKSNTPFGRDLAHAIPGAAAPPRGALSTQEALAS
jgi:hypothetical protein